MGILSWDTPKKKRSTEEHNAMHSSDSGVEGTYVPNMSEDDNLKWKAKLINKGKANARVEIRKLFPAKYAQVFIIVALDGWDLSSKGETKDNTSGLNVRISTNGAIAMTFKELNELNQAVEEAKKAIIAFEYL